MVVASADDDIFGQVQQVLPATLEAFVRLRSSALAFERESTSRAALLGRSESAAAVEIRALVEPVYSSASSPCCLFLMSCTRQHADDDDQNARAALNVSVLGSAKAYSSFAFLLRSHLPFRRSTELRKANEI